MILNNLQEIEKLFRLYLNDKCSQEQVQLLMHYFNLDQHEAALKLIIQSELEKPYDLDLKRNKEIKIVTERIFLNIKKNKNNTK